MADVGQEREVVKGEVSPSEVALKMALQVSREDYESQHLDLEEALAVSLQALDEVAATKDSELAATLVCYILQFYSCLFNMIDIMQFRFFNTHLYSSTVLLWCLLQDIKYIKL